MGLLKMNVVQFLKLTLSNRNNRDISKLSIVSEFNSNNRLLVDTLNLINVKIHPNYNPLTLENNIALIEVSQSRSITVKLPQPGTKFTDYVTLVG